MEESNGSASSSATGMAEDPAVRDRSDECFISIFGVDGPQHDSEARSEHRIPKAPAKFREYEKDNKYFDPWVVSLGPYHHGEDHVTLSQMEESRGIASSPATGMAEETVAITREAVRDPSDQEWLNFILNSPQPDPKARSKHRIPKAPAKFREYEKDKEYFDPWVVSLGPYHHGKDLLQPMQKYKITATKQFFHRFTNVTGGSGEIYKRFKELTEDLDLKKCYADEVVADMSDDVFARMMFLDGCFILRFIEEYRNDEEAETILEISKDEIPLIIRDMFLMENQLPFQVLDALMNLRWGSSNTGKENILNFIEWKVLIPMGFLPEKYSWLLKSPLRDIHLYSAADQPPDQRTFHGSLHLLDILRNILLDFTPSNGAEMHSHRAGNFGSVMELKEIGIGFEKRRMESLMGISFKKNLMFPQLLLPTMYINDTTISQLLNLTAFEAFSYSGCGVTSYIHFMDTLVNDGADVRELRSKGILHNSLGSDDEVARLFNKWPANVTNDLKLYSDISVQIRRYRGRVVNIATLWNKYFWKTYAVFYFVYGCVLLFFTVIQTYFTAFPRR